jgi:hypothetical protein
MSAVRERRKNEVIASTLRGAYATIVLLAVGFLLLLVVAFGGLALDASRVSDATGWALGGVAALVYVALVLDGPLLRGRLAEMTTEDADPAHGDTPQIADAQPSVEIDATSRIEDEVMEPTLPTEGAPDDAVSSEAESTITIRLRPLSP